jgi:hypothetical protein
LTSRLAHTNHRNTSVLTAKKPDYRHGNGVLAMA